MHKFSTAATKSSALTARPASAGAPGLLNVLQGVRLRGPLSRVAQRTQVVSRFRRFVTRTYAYSGL